MTECGLLRRFAPSNDYKHIVARMSEREIRGRRHGRSRISLRFMQATGFQFSRNKLAQFMTDLMHDDDTPEFVIIRCAGLAGG
jgi:hypothetical protein